MLKPEQVPYDAVRAAYAEWAGGGGNNVLSAMERAIAAALNAWPGMSQLEENDSASIREMAALILPLPPQEITLNTHNINALAVKSAGEEITLTEQEASDE